MRLQRAAVAVTALVLLVTGCVMEPVLDRLRIEFGAPGSPIDVTASIEIQDHAEPKSALAVRLERLRDDLVAERDFWSVRFGIVAPADEEYRRERSGGKVSKVVRRAFMDRNELARLLDGFAAVSFISGAGWEEVGIGVARSDRATSQEKRVVAGKLDRWSQEFAHHVRTVAELLRYLDQHPERERVVVAHVLVREGLDEKYRGDGLTDDERELVDRVHEGNDAVTGTLSEAASTGYTFEEMTRRVYDPFPSEITITTPGPIVACEGFVCEDGVARIPKLSLVGSLPALERWATPDPLLMTMSEGSLEDDLDTFLARPRFVAAALPGAIEVRSTVEGILKPASTYRLRWRIPEPDPLRRQ
jgi:hypothetical protein